MSFEPSPYLVPATFENTFNDKDGRGTQIIYIPEHVQEHYRKISRPSVIGLLNTAALHKDAQYGIIWERKPDFCFCRYFYTIEDLVLRTVSCSEATNWKDLWFYHYYSQKRIGQIVSDIQAMIDKSIKSY